MKIDREAFIKWIEDKTYDPIITQNEIKINSIFKESDRDHKLWCNTDGGKKGIELGVYHCWKTNKKGNLAGLIMEVDGCSFKEAIEILGGEIESSWEDLHKKVEELFSDPTKSIQDAEFIQEKTKFNLPEYSYPILDLPEWNPFRKKAEQYLKKRKIEIGNLLVAIKGRYYNRLVIPYYDKNNNLIYYNCRTLGKEVPKYLGPIKNELLNIGKDDVIFMPKWANHNSKLYLTEGEFDSITLFQCGLSSAALGGKNLSNYHVEVLKNYQLVVALDADNAGKLGLKSIAGEGSKLNTDSILFVRPPKEFKDWNEFYINYDASIVNKYIKTQEKPYYPSPVIGDWKSIELDCDDLN